MNINRSSCYYLGREVVLSLAILICLAYLQPAQAAGPITNGDSPTDTIDFDGEIDTWTFSANSGDGIRVNIGATDRVNFTPLIRLYDPGSTQVASNQGTFSADITWQAAQSGTYTVEVLDSSGTPNGTATYTLYLATIPGSFIIPAGDEGGEPKNGGVVNPGSIDLGDMDLWTYPADAGDTLLIHVGEINGTGLGPELVLYSPDGVELGSSNSTDATVLDHPAAVAGTYTVVVQDRAADVTGSGDYELYFAGIPGDAYSVPGPGDEGGALTNGGVHAGSITVGDLDLWTFEADVQDTLRIQVGEITGTNFSPELVLYGPDGSELGTNKGSASTDLDHQATVAGTYAVVVRDGTAARSGSGDYELHFASIPGGYVIPGGDEGGALTNGGLHAGSITLGDMDLWTYQADAGDTLRIQVGEINGTGLGPELLLYGPDGNQLTLNEGTNSTSLDYPATVAGTYTVVVRDGTTDVAGTGDYELHFAAIPGVYVIPGGDEGGALTSGMTHPGSITLGDLDLWTFQADALDNISLQLNEVVTTTLTPSLYLYGPDGNQLAFDNNLASASIAHQVAVAGSYTVVARDSTGDVFGTGDYELDFTLTPDTTTEPAGSIISALQNGDRLSASYDSSGDIDKYSLVVTAGDRVRLQLGDTAGSASISPVLQVFASDGVLLANASDSNIARVAFTAGATETLTVVVLNSSTGTGTYDLFTAIAPQAYTTPGGDEGGALDNGNVASGNWSLADIDMYSLSVSAGDRVRLQLGDTAGSASISPVLQVFASDGVLLANASDSNIARVAFTAGATETLTVVVFNSGAGAGDYDLFTAVIPQAYTTPAGDEGGALDNGNVASGNWTLADIDMYSLSVSAGDRVRLQLGDTAGSASISPVLQVFASDGVLLANASDSNIARVAFTAGATDTLTVVVSNSSTGTGTYDLFTAIVPQAYTTSAGDEGGALDNGNVASGNWSLADIDMYSLSVSAGDRVRLQLGDTAGSASISPVLQVFASDGVLLADASDSNIARVAFTAGATETLTVVVFNSGAGAGDYDLFTAVIPQAYTTPAGDEGGALSNGLVASGSWTLADVDIYTFSVLNGASVSMTLDDTLVSASVSPVLEVFASDGSLTGSASSATSAQLDFIAETTDTLTVVVYNSGTGTGTYDLLANGITSLDSDSDGLSDALELMIGTSLSDSDTDNDGVSDFDEVNYDSDATAYDPATDLNPLAADTDGDGFLDGGEVALGTDPLNAGSTPGSPLRVSTNSAGDEARGKTASTSADGRYIAFESNATNLSAADTNGDLWDIFVKDTQTGITTLVSTDSSGNGANGESFNPVISADGRYVVFDSDASNLVGSDTNGVKDVFIKDTVTGVTERLSVDTDGNEGNANSLRPDISADGRFVVFDSVANDLVASDTNSASDIFIRDTLNDTTTRLSVHTTGIQSGADSFRPRISADGRYVAFSSNATNLVAGDTNAVRDIFMRDTQDNVTTRISQDTAGNQATGGWSFSPAISADGRYVAFYSEATNLVAGDSNTATDIFLRDTLSGVTTRVSTDSSGTQANGASALPEISADGRFVVFDSLASNLVASDTGIKDVFVKDVWTGTTVRLSTDSGGIGGNAQSHTAAISADAVYVVFDSDASNLVTGDGNSTTDVFRALQSLYSPDTDGDGLHDDIETMLGTGINDTDSDDDGLSDYDEINHDLDAFSYTPGFDTDPLDGDTDGDGFLDGGEVQFGSDPLSAGSVPDSPLRISLDSAGAEGNASNNYPAVSDDGRYVVFESYSDNLVPDDTNGVQDIFVKDAQTGVITRVSTSSAGNQADNTSISASISADGRYVAFESSASNLVAGDTNGVWDVFVKDTQTGGIVRVSTDSGGTTQGNDDSFSPALSADGRYVVFMSGATNLAGVTVADADIFLKDIQTGVTTLLSTDSSGTAANDGSFSPTISADGRYVVFESHATNLVTGDTVSAVDIFLKDTQTDATTLLSAHSIGTAGNNDSFSPVISADGRYVAFSSTATNLVAGDTNSERDVFVKDTQTDELVRVSTDGAGSELEGFSSGPDISADGRYVAYQYAADGVLEGSGFFEIYVKDILTAASTRLSTDSNGTPGNDTSHAAAISADGSYVAFSSEASDLVGGDTNTAEDVFRVDNPSFSPDTDGDGLHDDVETGLGTDINDTDSDDDGISDYDEVSAYGGVYSYETGFETDPNNPDTDGDGYLDGGEVQFGSDPLSAGSVPDSPIRVSTDSAGDEGDALSYTAVVSADGRYVAFESDAANLVTGDANTVSDIFIKDTQTGITTRVSTDSNGVEGNAESYSAAISGDGRYVAFRSQASNLVAGDTNGTWDIFVKDTETGITTRVSTDSGGIQGNNASDKPVISSDGRYVAFSSPANNLVADDGNPTWDVFLKDTQTGITTRVSIDSAELDANGASDKPAISADGRYVAFYSWSTNLVASDTNGVVDIFIRDTQTGDTTRVSTDGAGLEGNGDSFDPVLSADGRYVAFKSSASTLVPGDLNNKQDVFLKDTQTGVITRVSTDSADAEGNDHSLLPALSADGRYVAFSSYARNLVAGDTNFHSDVFVKDTLTGQTVRASVDSGGTEGDTYSLQPSITADGHYVVFYSLASNLVTGDTNGLIDVFRAENPEFSPDTDGDGLRDDVDAFPNDPTETVDFDGDGIGNNADPDDDNDGMPDSFEITHGLDLLDPSDASADADGDGYDNESEFRAGTDPNNNGESPGTVAALHYKILANDGEIADYYGSSVAIDGDTALIGSRGDDGNGADSGSAYVYLRDSAGNWNLQQKLTAGDGAAAYDYFGLSVSLSGDTALIGAYGTSDIGTNSGAAYVFTRLGSIWSEQDKLTATIAAAYDNFGQSVVIDGDTALIGASGDDTKESDAGAAYVFTRTGSNWSEQAKLTAGDGAANDYLGNSVSLSGDTALIGAAEDDHSVTNSGSAYVFTRSGLLWSEQAKLTANDAAANDYFGNSVSLSGDTALIGAEEDDDNGNGSGSVYVFTRNGINWSEQAKLLPGDGAADQYFGYEVTVDGSLALVGAPGDAADKGATYIFTADAQGNWTEYQKLAANDGTDSGQSWGGEGSPGDQFGIAVARSGDRVLVGASLDDDNGADAGSAYLFELDLPPVANNDTDTLLEGGSKVIYLAANDTDANGDLDPASIVITSQPANRATDVVVNAGGTVYYTHDGSETTSDSFTYTIADLNGNVSLEGTVELTITSANDAPALDLDGTVAGVNFATTFTEGAGGVAVVDSDASLDDPDSGDQVENAFLSIGSPTAEDVLYVQGGQAALDLINSNITWVGAETPDQPFVALSGAATPAEYLAAIQLVRYDNSSSQPNIPPSRLVSITVDDGEVSSPVAAAVITINAVNSDFTAADDSYIVDEDTINNALNVTSNDIDPDGTEPVISLIVTPPANGTAVPSGDGHSIFYTPAENFSGVDTIVYEASDGGFTHQATVTITVNNQNDRPVLDLDGVAGGSTGYATAFTEGSGAVALTGGAVITDLDSTDMLSAAIALNPAKTGDLLSIQGTASNLPAGITAVEAPDGSYILLSGSPLAPTASWEQALDLIRFENGLVGPDVTQRSVAFIVNDESGAVSLAAFTTIDILVDDDPPLLDLDADGAGTGYAANFVTGQGSSGVAIVDSDVSIIDDGALITAASVSITNALAGDALTVGSLPAGISASGAGTASVTLSGDATAADYQSALVAIDFSNSLPAPLLTQRVIDVSVTDDGSNISNTAITTVSLQAAPVVDLNGTDAGESFSTRFTIGSNTAVAITDTDADILDADSASLTQLAITLTNPAAGDELTVDTVQLNTLGIAVEPASTATYKLLTGTVSKANYISALAQVGYLNTATVPDPTARLIEFVATDTDLHQGLPTITTVGIGSDFAITFDAMPEIVLADATLAYTINVTNVGTTSASDLVLTSVLDEDAFITDMLDPHAAGWDCSDFQSGINPTAVCNLPGLSPGATVSLTVEIMTPAVTREIINSVTVTNSDPSLGTGTASQSNLVVNFLDGTGFLPEQKVTDTDGATIFGDSGADFGSSVVLRDDLLIVGSPDDFDGTSDGNGIQSGAVVIYQRLPSGWVQLPRLVKPGAHAPGDEFGRSLAWDGNWLVVGSPGAGEVHVFDSGFANPQTLAVTDGSASLDNDFGRAVAISNSRIAVGSPRADINGSNNGRVYLFEENAGVWAQAGSVDSAEVGSITGISSDNSDFGAAVALQGDRLVIGAPYENGPVSQGVVLLYEYTGGSWLYQQALLKPTIDKPDAFGRSLDIEGDSIVVGAMFHDSGHPDSGAAHVFSRDASGNWNHDQKLVASNAISGEEFGISVDLQGDTLLVGAYGGLNPIPNFVSGIGYVFQRTGSVWNEQQIVSATDAALDDRFGMAVAMDGDRIALGAPADDDNTLADSGSVYILQIRTNPADKLLAFDRTVDAEFGTTLAVSGDTLVVGAPYHDHSVAGNDNKGAAYVYRRASDSWQFEKQLLASNAANDDHFGWSVDISGDRIVVGVPGRDGTFANSGMAYVYSRIETVWIEQQQLLGQAQDAEDNFGAAVAIDGDRIAIGVPGAEAIIMAIPFVDAGVVEVFDFGGTWTYQDTLVASAITTGLGHALDVEGDIIVAAALNANAYVFEGSAGWVEQQILGGLSTAVTSVALFGDQSSSAPVAGDMLVLGSGYDTDMGVDAGAVNSYHWAGSWVDDGKLYADDAGGNARFGASIALFGDQLLVAAPGDSESANEAGAAYLYKSISGNWAQRGKILTNDAEQSDALGGGSPTAVAINLDGRIIGAYREDGQGSGTNYGAVYTSFTAPTSSLPTGSFSANQLVTLGCDDCADIYYTTNGSTPTTSSTRYTDAITIEAVGGLTTTTNLRFIAVDSQGNSSSVQTTSLLIDVEDPTVVLDPASPYQGGGVVDTALLPIEGVAADEAGGSGLRQVQLELRDAAGEYVLIDDEGVFQGMTSTQTWLTATTTDGWATWTLPITTVPFVEGGTYSLRVRGYDQTGNVSDFINTGFTYFTGTAAFMTLDLNISASSILNLPGDSPTGEGEIDASVKLTDPSDLGTDLTGSSISLDITDPNGVVTVVPLVTNINGQETLQDLGDGSVIDFNIEGAWTLQAHYPGTTTRNPADSAPLNLLVGTSAGSAVIVVGRLDSNEGLQSHNKTGKRIYDILISRGFQADDIEFYSPDTNRDGIIDGLDGTVFTDGIDAIPSRANVQTAIQGMAARSNASPAPRYVFMVDHGSPNAFLLNSTESIMPDDLDLWLDGQEALLDPAALAKPSVVVLGMCYSGSFLLETAVDDDNNPSPVDRVVIASAAPDEESYKGTEESDGIRVGEFFLEEFVKEAARGASLKAAFVYATTQTEIFTRKSDIAMPDPLFNDVAAQHPLLEDNRLFDPVQLAANNLLKSSATADGALSDKLYLGVGPTYATNAVSNPADIIAVTETVFLSADEDSRLLTLTTNDDTKVASAWIEVRAPATQLTPSGGSIQLDPVLTRSIMNPPITDTLESWFTTYDQFTLSGKYEIFYFVEDLDSGEISPIRRSVVYRNTIGNADPGAPSLLLPADTATTDNEILFDWSESIDPEEDPVTYTLEITTDDTFTTVDYRYEDITDTYTYVGPEAGFQDLTTYYWRVIAVDSLGGRGVSGSFSFTTELTNALRGVVFATVSNAISDVLLQGATVIAVNDSGATVAPLETAYMADGAGGTFYRKYPDGVYDITITNVDGFASATEEGVDVSVNQQSYATVLPAASADADGDGIDDSVETANGTNPNSVDTDQDGIVDGAGGAVLIGDYPTGGGYPLPVDTDGDGYVDGELDFGNNPTVADYADGNIGPYPSPDTVLNIADYLVATRIVLDGTPVAADSPEALGHIDMNADGEVNAGDLVLLLKAIQSQ